MVELGFYEHRQESNHRSIAPAQSRGRTLSCAPIVSSSPLPRNRCPIASVDVTGGKQIRNF